MRGRTWVPAVVVACLVIGLPAVALTETGVEKEVKEAVGVNTDECTPTRNLSSPWLEGPKLAERRDEPRAVAIGDSIYLIGGTVGLESLDDERNLLDPSAELTRFDPRTGRYQRLAPMPRPLNHVGVTVYRGDIYVLGGYGRYVDAQTSRAFYRYDPETDSWSRLPDMPAPRAAGAVGILDGRLVWAGGAKNSLPRDEVFAYDFRTRRWSRLPAMGSRREHVGEAVLGGRLYVLGGRGSESLALDTAERYDPVRGEWESLPRMPVPSGGVAAVALDDAVVTVGGGDDGAETVTGAIQEFDPATDEWNLLPELRTARHGHGVAVADGEIWAFGGSECAYFNATDDVEHISLGELRGEAR